jgi:outer membrane protein TolC
MMHVSIRRPLCRWRHAGLLILVAAALGGCIRLGPDYVKPETAVPDQWSSAHGEGAREDLAEWWQKLEDPLLSEPVAAALRAARLDPIQALRHE